MAKPKKPLVVVTRRLPDSVETRMRELFDNGLNLKTTGDCALIAPPLIAEKAHVDEIVDILRKTVVSL